MTEKRKRKTTIDVDPSWLVDESARTGPPTLPPAAAGEGRATRRGPVTVQVEDDWLELAPASQPPASVPLPAPPITAARARGDRTPPLPREEPASVPPPRPAKRD